MKKYAREFKQSTAEQRSPAWYKERAGIPTASGLGFLFDVLKDGRTPSAKQKQYLTQLAFERKFGVTYDKFDTVAMQNGRYYEEFAAKVYERDTGNVLDYATSYVSSWFVATPDKHVMEELKAGLLECKVVGDKTFLEMIEGGIPLGHELQTQGQLMASGLDWVDYVVVNIKTEAYFIKRVPRNNKLIKRIYERLHEPLNLPELSTANFDVKRFDSKLLTDFVGGGEQEEKIDLPF